MFLNQPPPRDAFVCPIFPVTGNRCKHIGYDDFAPNTWYSDCAPDTNDWIDLDMGICGEANAYPEEFWACSDISITSGEKTEGPLTRCYRSPSLLFSVSTWPPQLCGLVLLML